MKDVRHHLQVIEHDPLARRETVDRSRTNVVFVLESRLNFPGDRLQLRF